MLVSQRFPCRNLRHPLYPEVIRASHIRITLDTTLTELRKGLGDVADERDDLQGVLRRPLRERKMATYTCLRPLDDRVQAVGDATLGLEGLRFRHEPDKLVHGRRQVRREYVDVE